MIPYYIKVIKHDRPQHYIFFFCLLSSNFTLTIPFYLLILLLLAKTKSIWIRHSICDQIGIFVNMVTMKNMTNAITFIFKVLIKILKKYFLLRCLKLCFSYFFVHFLMIEKYIFIKKKENSNVGLTQEWASSWLLVNPRHDIGFPLLKKKRIATWLNVAPV